MELNGAYGVLKIAWHKDRIETMRAGGQAVPVGLQLILSDLCNHDCFFCAYRASEGLSSSEFGAVEDGKYTHNPNRMIPYRKAREIIEDAHDLGVKSITFTGGGEPTVHPQHLDLFRQALDAGMDCSLNTNGALLRPGWELVLPRMTYVRFSIDGGTAEEYARIRRVPASTYEKVLHHLTQLVAEVRASGSKCTVGTGYVVTPDNWMNVVEGVRRIRDTGASYVRLASMQSTAGVSIYNGNLAPAKQAIRDAQQLATKDFQVVDLFESALGRRMTDPFCGFQQLVMYIGANLKVYRCCYVAYTKAGEAGDLSNARLFDWFNSAEKFQSYRDFDARSCATCPLADKNAVIGYLANPQPMHVNFV